MKKKTSIIFVVIVVILCLILFINIYDKFSGGRWAKKAQESSKASKSSVEMLIDTTQFSKISPESLIAILGEPVSIDEWVFNKGTSKAVDTTTYAYDVDGIHYEFLIMDGVVNSLHLRADWNGATVDLKVGLNEDIFALLGIQPSKDVRLVADTGAAVRWRPVNDKIAEVWALSELKSETNAPVDIQVRYDLTYFP